MSNLGIALLLKPLIFLLIFALIIIPLKWIVWKLLPEGRLKRLLFFSWKV